MVMKGDGSNFLQELFSRPPGAVPPGLQRNASTTCPWSIAARTACSPAPPIKVSVHTRTRIRGGSAEFCVWLEIFVEL